MWETSGDPRATDLGEGKGPAGRQQPGAPAIRNKKSRPEHSGRSSIRRRRQPLHADARGQEGQAISVLHVAGGDSEAEEVVLPGSHTGERAGAGGFLPNPEAAGVTAGARRLLPGVE